MRQVLSRALSPHFSSESVLTTNLTLGNFLWMHGWVETHRRRMPVSLNPDLLSNILLTKKMMFRGVFIDYENERPVQKTREWKNYPFNFDDIGNAMLTLCTVSTFEGWPGYDTDPILDPNDLTVDWTYCSPSAKTAPPLDRLSCGGLRPDIQLSSVCGHLLHHLHHSDRLLHGQHLRRLRDRHLSERGRTGI